MPELPPGYHLITRSVLEQTPELKKFSVGIFHLFLKHTSAGLTINENADPDVRSDMKMFFDHLIPENYPHFIHTSEGPDDMPAHIKSSLIGCSLSIPVTSGRLNLGTWQGIYLCEFRRNGGSRKLVATIIGE